ncbi:MAG: PQQ-dependent sugar dehydrogenase [Bacteroidia bacterium]|nr:PQQ-dependent sugar dehydrogenase [Bacteroidia bacterium]
MKTLLSSLLLAAIFTIVSCKDKSNAQPEEINLGLDSADVALDTLYDGLSAPWGIEFVGENILITEKSGELLLWNGTTATTISGLPLFRRVGQGGLLDACKHPDYENNSIIYLCGSAGSSNTLVSTALYRGVLNGNALTNVELLFTAAPQNSSGAHFGSRILFDNSGMLFLSLGERNSMSTAQDLSNHNGCVIRLNDDGSIPSDNPFVNGNDAQNAIWTYGHRNVQGMTLHPESGEIWTHEHGPKGGEEVNILKKGANYGWPLASFGINYNGDIITKDTFVEGTERPVHYWVPSIAPCGMDFYYSDSIPQWKGNLFLGALAGKHLNMLTIVNNQVVSEERLLQNMARFRAVRQGPDGALYIITESPGMLLRLRPE